MIGNITATLSHIDKTVWMLDNNQRGHPLKFQRFGSSNKFVKVTGRTSKQCTVSLIDLGEEDDKHCILTYVDQAIVNPVNFPAFELEFTDTNSMTQIHSALTRTKGLCESPTKMDITGNRVSVYLSLIDIVSTITNTIRPLLTGYNATTNKYKNWKN